MLREQLNLLKKSKRTILHTKNSLVKFIEDDDVDSQMLYNLLPFPTEYTTSKSLNFDRHQLSEREEKKFNIKFSKFLKGLIVEMNNPKIDILLEYLCRIYSIDTFNSDELVFLLTPFEKFYRQLSIISRNSKNQFSSLRSYSIPAISRIIVKDRYILANYVEYYKHYDILSKFLDATMDEIIELVKLSDLDYLSEFYYIFEHLLSCGNHRQALSIFHRLKGILETDEFVSLLESKFSRDQIIMTEQPKLGNMDLLYKTSAGMSLLNDYPMLALYLKHLIDSDLIPKEFSDTEFKILANVLLDKNYPIENFSLFNDMFLKLKDRTAFTKYFISLGVEEAFIDNFNDEEKILALNKNFDVNLLTPSNYELILRNLDKETIDLHYQQILDKALSFSTFNEKYFENFIEGDPCSYLQSNGCVRNNLLKLAYKLNYNLVEAIFKLDIYKDAICLSYLFDVIERCSNNQIIKIVEASKCLRNLTVYTKLMKFYSYLVESNKAIQKKLLEALSSIINVNTIAEFGINSGFVSAMEPFVSQFRKDIDLSLHYVYFIETMSDISLDILIDSRQSFIPRLYDENMFDHLLFISKKYSIKTILIQHDKVLDLLGKAEITDDSCKLPVCEYLIAIYSQPKALDLLLSYLDEISKFTYLENFEDIKVACVTRLFKTNQIQKALAFIIQNISEFTFNDQYLFDALFESNVKFDANIFRSLKPCIGTALLIDSYIRYTVDDILPILPFIAPTLITYKMKNVEQLFSKYSHIMGIYSKNIVTEYPEACHVLTYVDPRYSLRFIANFYSAEFETTLLKILNTKECTSSNILVSLLDLFTLQLESSFGYLHFSALLGFYKRSFVDLQHVQEVSDLLINLFKKQRSTFINIATDYVNSLGAVFTESVLLLIDQILRDKAISVDKEIEILCNFSELPEFVDSKKASKLFDLTIKTEIQCSSDLSAKLLSYYSDLIEKKMNSLIKSLSEEINGTKEIEVLAKIYKNISGLECYKEKLLPHVINYCENGNESQIEQANILLETLQSY